MHSLHPDLTRAMAQMLDKMEHSIRLSGYSGGVIKMFLAGGMAVHYYCGTRYTEDVDASFSHRLLLPGKELAVDYQRADGSPSVLYFDANYNDHFALMHPDYRENALEWEDIGNGDRALHLYVLSPVDLAVSKISRFSEQDRDDILSLAHKGLITSDQLRTQATEALDYYVGDTTWVCANLDQICTEITSSL